MQYKYHNLLNLYRLHTNYPTAITFAILKYQKNSHKKNSYYYSNTGEFRKRYYLPAYASV